MAAWFARRRNRALIWDKVFHENPGRGHVAALGAGSIGAMKTPDRRLSQLRKLAWACAVLVLAITSLSAFIRLSRAGLGCEPWPQCYAQRAAMAPQALDTLDSAAVSSARIAHRVVASVALLLVIFLLVKTLGQQPVLRRQGRLVLGLLGLALFLAVLGRMAGPSRAAFVGVANLLGGLAMFALSLRLVQATGAWAPAATAPRTWTLAALVLLLLQIAMGGLVSVTQLSDRCGEAALCQWHRGTALAVLALLVPLGIVALRRGARVLGGVLVLLALAQAALGLAMLWLPAVPLAMGLAHNVLAGLLLAALLALLPAPSLRS